MQTKFISIIFCCLFSISLAAQKTDAVLLNYHVEFIQNDNNKGAAKYKVEYLINNEKGKRFSDILISQDKFQELKSFSGEILSSKEIADPKSKKGKKLSKSDLQTIAYSPHWNSDSKYSVYSYSPPSYPFVIKYEYEVSYKNGISFYPPFAPVRDFGIPVENTSYTITFPSSNKVRYKTFNHNTEPKITENNGQTTYKWEMTAIPSVEKEPFCPSLSQLAPAVIFAPTEFCMDGECGNMQTWETMGNWVASLLKDRDNLNDEQKNKVRELVKGIDSDKEKVKKLYEHLQANTRYVSIQLGIGGYQPIAATDVARTGYGDCKALSNYMKAMLNAVDIPSHYTVISTVYKKVYDNFPSFTQMNHVILCVPLQNDTLWLECTSPNLPFNYTHSDIEGHDVLLIDDATGKLSKVTPYTGKKGKSLNMNFTIDEQGNASGGINMNYYFDEYEYMQYFVHHMDRNEKVNAIAHTLNLSKITVNELNVNTVNSESPQLQVNCNANAEKYANKSGNRLFIPTLGIGISKSNLLKNGKRNHDIQISNEMISNDTLTFIIPESFSPESLPKPANISTEFGDFLLKVSYNDNTLEIVQALTIKKGKYPAEKANDFMEFLKSINRESNKKSVFKTI